MSKNRLAPIPNLIHEDDRLNGWQRPLFVCAQRALVDSGRAINVDQHSGWTAGFGAAPAG